MRIAVLSDIHGNLAALEAVVADFTRRGVDQVVNLGDNLSGPLLPRETAQFLMSQPWMHLAGNHERQVLTLPPESQGPSDAYARSQLGPTELDWLATLRPSHWLNEEIFLCHGTPGRDCEYFFETVDPTGLRAATAAEIEVRLDGIQAAVIACGHTHVPRSLRSGHGQLLVNPGSVGLPAYEDTHPVYHAVETGSPDARYAILERHSRRWSCQLLTVPYDASPMSDLARLRGRKDWEQALRTGYLLP